MNLYQRLLGTPFVYNHIRPLIVGGIDMSPFYDRVGVTSSDVVLDIGCGTGDALKHLTSFARYVGIDTDARAIAYAAKTYAGKPGVSFESRLCVPADMTTIQPTRLMLCGVLHHMPDEAACGLLELAKLSPKLERLVTSDIVFLERDPLNNLLARLDRGCFCRREEAYRALVAKAGLRLVKSEIVSGKDTLGIAKYVMMTIER